MCTATDTTTAAATTTSSSSTIALLIWPYAEHNVALNRLQAVLPR